MSDAGRGHLRYLDGLRAMAALAVLAFHALTMMDPNLLPDGFHRLLGRWVVHGQLFVVIFIVLSGYCLMLPVASSAEEKLRGGLTGFFQRRFWRIYPAYLANVAVGLALTLAIQLLAKKIPSIPASYAEPIKLFDVATHLLMVHIFWFETTFGINGVLWSVATEWWIYVIFALLLIPLWRRFGAGVTAIVALALGYLPLALPAASNFSWARPWYLGAFGFGMAVAAWNVSARPGHRRFNERFPWGIAAAGMGVLLVGIHLTIRLTTHFLPDALVGLAAACFLGALYTGAAPWWRKLLETPFLQTIGTCSYTLYLFHPYILKLLTQAGRTLHLPPTLTLAMNVLVGIPVSVVLSHFLAMALEKPFLKLRAKGKVRDESGGAARSAAG